MGAPVSSSKRGAASAGTLGERGGGGWVGWMLIYVHRNRRLIIVRDGSPGRPPRLSHSSWALCRGGLVGWALLYVHRNRRLIRDGSPGRATSTFTSALGLQVRRAQRRAQSASFDISDVMAIKPSASQKWKGRHWEEKKKKEKKKKRLKGHGPERTICYFVSKTSLLYRLSLIRSLAASEDITQKDRTE